MDRQGELKARNEVWKIKREKGKQTNSFSSQDSGFSCAAPEMLEIANYSLNSDYFSKVLKFAEVKSLLNEL